MTDHTRQQAWEAVRDSVDAFLELTGRQASDLRAEIGQMLEELRPDIEYHLAQSLAGRDASRQSLQLLGDAVVARTAQLALLAGMRERLALAAVIQAVLRTVLTLAG